MRVFSTWGSVRLWETRLERRLHERYSLRTHGFLIGTLTLLLTWGVSTLLMQAGVDALAKRYLLSLGVGYLAYLLMLRLWARRLVRRMNEEGDRRGDGSIDAPADLAPSPSGGSHGGSYDAPAIRSGGGGDFGGGGASGDFEPGGAAEGFQAAAESGSALADVADVAGEALGAAAGADEGAVIVVPVVAVFLAGLAVLLGAGSLVLLFFGFDVLLAVAIELAFAYASARAAARVVREGWLTAAARLTWKPLLGALLCAVLTGALVDYLVPQADSLPGAVRILMRG